jgi:hypothetical protein
VYAALVATTPTVDVGAGVVVVVVVVVAWIEKVWYC